MSGAGLVPLAVGYATASAEAVGRLVTERFGLGGEVGCRLLLRGFNDVYEVTAGERFVLRISGHRARGPADVAAETAFLAHLHGAGVAVAAAVPARDGRLFCEAVLPDGVRAAVLFRHAEGRVPELDEPGDARVQGEALALVHQVAEEYAEREAGRYQLELPHLLHRPVQQVLALDLHAPQARLDLVALTERLALAVGRLEPELSRIRCHGDCHGLNARIRTEGAWARRAVLFDFDDGGFGFLAYDLAVHLWAQVSFRRRRFAMWHAFDAGYRSVRPIRPADEAAVPLFVAVRHIWLMGEYAGQAALWGNEVLTGAWLEREVGFLLRWERERLSPGLF